MARYEKLNAENAYIWRIVHRDNLPWVLNHGLHCGNSGMQSPTWVDIGNKELIDKRSHRSVPLTPYGTLSDYVPFYFTPFSPMMYNIHTGRGEVSHRSNSDIVILVSTLHRVKEQGHRFVFTDQHAYTALANYYDDLNDLDNIDWALLQDRNFQRNPDDPQQFERYQAEALIYQHLPVDALIGIVCHADEIRLKIEEDLQSLGVELNVKTMKGWYF